MKGLLTRQGLAALLAAAALGLVACGDSGGLDRERVADGGSAVPGTPAAPTQPPGDPNDGTSCTQI